MNRAVPDPQSAAGPAREDSARRLAATPRRQSQRTLARAVEVRGTGVHSGLPAVVRLRPAPAGSGLRFVRTDRSRHAEIPVGVASLASGQRCTALAWQGVAVRVVEHLLAACVALGLDNARFEVDAEELPILDGSALGWARALQETGLVAQDAARAAITLRAPVLWSEGQTVLMALPADALRLTVASVTEHRVAGRQMVDLLVEPDTFMAQLAPARTFCFREEIEALRAAGLAQGGSLDNALVVGDDGYSSPLRVDQELAAHKALDLLGDLATLGAPLRAHVVAIRPGHAANQQLVRLIWSHLGLLQPGGSEADAPVSVAGC